MLNTADNELICRVGAGTGMGNVMRSYWLPALVSYELDGPERPVVPFTLLGEDLVAFREDSGGVGVLGAQCPHRCAPLSLARNQDNALTCLYHGWKMDKTGTLVEVPSEPEDSPLVGKKLQKSYRAVEKNGLIWVYMGSDDTAPDLPNFNWMDLPTEQVSIQKAIVEANWLQSLEGLLDSAHISFLHSDRVVGNGDGKKTAAKASEAETVLTTPSKDTRPRIEVEKTDYGFRYAALRRPQENPDTHAYARVTGFVMPFYCFIPVGEGEGQMEYVIPIDDERTLYFGIAYNYSKPVDDELIRRQMGRVWDRDIRPDHTRIASRENGWRQDRIAMAEGRSFTGLNGSFDEDAAVTEGMGRIVDRTMENLGTSDRAIAYMRRIMLNAARNPEFTPVGITAEQTRRGSLVATDGLVALDGRWQSLGYETADANKS